MYTPRPSAAHRSINATNGASSGTPERLEDGERLRDLRRSLEVRPLSARVEETLRRADRAPEQCIGGGPH
jgi:hypothetical protein